MSPLGRVALGCVGAVAVLWLVTGIITYRIEAQQRREWDGVMATLAPKPGPRNAVASYIDHRYHGRKTASGERYNEADLTCAHPWLPFGTLVEFEREGRRAQCRVNDRGPFIPGREFDLSRAAARRLGLLEPGVADVQVEVVE